MSKRSERIVEKRIVEGRVLRGAAAERSEVDA